jgi:hypothetical protein
MYYKPIRNKQGGFCVILNNSINVCLQYYKIYKNYNLYLDIPELDQIFDFGNQNIENIENIENFEPIWINSNFDNSSNAHVVCDIQKLREKNRIFNLFFPFKNLDFFENESNKFINDTTLGLHIRGTDKFTEIVPPNIDSVISNIRSILNDSIVNNIFLATDDKYYKDIILNEFGDLVKTRDVTISLDRKPIHFIDDRSNINLEVMTDVYLLSKCSHFFYCFSNVSYSALILGIDNFKKIECINEL